jgi:hypothetical protein
MSNTLCYEWKDLILTSIIAVNKYKCDDNIK